MPVSANPYRPGDFVDDGHGQIVAFKGPVFSLVYPDRCDLAQEVLDWGALGYHVSHAADDEAGPRVAVLGDIPEYLQNRLRAAGVEITQTKTRGQTTEYHAPFAGAIQAAAAEL